jgi:hypothetical protein
MAKKPRKWSNLKGQLPAPPVDDNERLRRIDEAKAERLTRTMDELAAEWARLDVEHDAAKVAERERNIKYAALEARILEEIDKIKAMAGTDIWRGAPGTFSPRYLPFSTVTDRDALLKWVKDSGLEDRLVTDLPTSTLNDIVKAALDPQVVAYLTPAQRAALRPGQPGSMQPPPGVKVYLKTTVGRTDASETPAKDEEEE